MRNSQERIPEHRFLEFGDPAFFSFNCFTARAATEAATRRPTLTIMKVLQEEKDQLSVHLCREPNSITTRNPFLSTSITENSSHQKPANQIPVSGLGHIQLKTYIYIRLEDLHLLEYEITISNNKTFLDHQLYPLIGFHKENLLLCRVPDTKISKTTRELQHTATTNNQWPIFLQKD